MKRQSGLGIAVIGDTVVADVLLARRWYLRWESGDPLPGDELITAPDLTATRAITVRAPAGQVWPWVAQLGQGRGGFYSYDFLENLVGYDIHSADRVVAEWQDIKTGDKVSLHSDVALGVAVGAGNYVASCDLRIFVDQAAGPVPPQNTHTGHFHSRIRAPRGRVLMQRPVRPVAVIVTGILTKDQPQMPFAGDQHPVQALAAGTAGPAFRDRVRTRRPYRGLDDPHAGRGDYRAERPR